MAGEVRGRDVDVDALCRAVNSASYTLRAFRENRNGDVRDYAGSNYSENSRETKIQYVNMLASYVSIVGRQLIANQPRFMLTTFNEKAKPQVSKMQSWANAEVERMDLALSLQRVVVDALFSIGITKVALSDPGHSATKGWTVPSGTAFADVVDLDDFVYDVHARTFHDASFIGHRYRMPLAVAKEMREFNKTRRQDLEASQDPRYTQQGDERTDSLIRAYTGDSKEFEDMVDLWEIYLPRHNQIVTISLDQTTGASSFEDPLRVQRWIGPDTGPYHILGFGVVPNNAMPKAPIQDLRDMNDLLNNMWRKLARQIRRMKTITAVRGSADTDGKRTIDASDGEMIRLDDPESIREVVMGGANPLLFGTAQQVKDVLSWMAGNLDLAGGLSPQSKTATQDKLLNENAGAIMSAMQNQVTRHVQSAGKALCWFWWHDPYRVMRDEFSPPGLPPGMSISRTLTPRDRIQVPWDDVECVVDPYSLPYQSPAQRLQLLNSVVTQVTPMMPLLQQQGMMFDVYYYLKKVAEYANCPDILQMFTVSTPPPTDQSSPPGQDAMGGMAPETTRNYVRRSLGSDTANNRANDSSNLARELGALNGAVNPSSNGQGY